MRDEAMADKFDPIARRVQRLDEPQPFEVVMGYVPGEVTGVPDGHGPGYGTAEGDGSGGGQGNGEANGAGRLGPTTIAFVLWPRTWGAGTDAAVVVPATADVVTFDIRLESHEFSRYAIAVKELVSNQIVWRTNRVTVKSTADHASVIAVIPARILKPRHYTVDLTGRNADGGLELISRCPFELLAR
jgi:hypothetical protein